LDTDRVQVIRLSGKESGHTAEKCTAASGRRELTSAECGQVASLLSLEFGDEDDGTLAGESGCMQWGADGEAESIEYLSNSQEETCKSYYCYCAYDVPHPPPPPAGRRLSLMNRFFGRGTATPIDERM
jgi:hypothetical protein